MQELFNSLACGGVLLLAAPGGEKDTQYLARLCKQQRVTCASFVPSQLDVLLQARTLSTAATVSFAVCLLDYGILRCRSLRPRHAMRCATSWSAERRCRLRWQRGSGSACRVRTCTTRTGRQRPLWTPRVRLTSLLSVCSLQSVVALSLSDMNSSAYSAGYDVTAEFKGGATVPIGQPIANMRCYVLDAQLQLVPMGVPGELMVSGIQLARGYLKRPDLTDEKFIPNPYSGGAPHHSRLYRTGACPAQHAIYPATASATTPVQTIMHASTQFERV